MSWNTFMYWKLWKIALFKWFNICSSLYTVELPVGEQRRSQLSWPLWDSSWKPSGMLHETSVRFSRTRGCPWHTCVCMLSYLPISPTQVGSLLGCRGSHGQSQTRRSSGTKSVNEVSFWRKRRECLLTRSLRCVCDWAPERTPCSRPLWVTHFCWWWGCKALGGGKLIS